jgi:hypothetical protein
MANEESGAANVDDEAGAREPLGIALEASWGPRAAAGAGAAGSGQSMMSTLGSLGGAHPTDWSAPGATARRLSNGPAATSDSASGLRLGGQAPRGYAPLQGGGGGLRLGGGGAWAAAAQGASRAARSPRARGPALERAARGGSIGQAPEPAAGPLDRAELSPAANSAPSNAGGHVALCR